MTKTIQNGGFTNPTGGPLTGNLLLVLSQDAKVAANPNQVAPIATRIPITSGNIASTLIYFNDELLPGNTTYTATAYDATGNKVYGPEIWSLTGAGPLDLGTLVPLLISPDPLFSNPVLQNPSVPQTITGQGLTLTSSAPLTVQGTLTVSGTGALNACKTAGVLLVDSANTCGWTGADIGAQINSAVAALPAAGGTIALGPGTFSYSTPIVIAVVGKFVRLLGSMEDSTVLNYTPATSTIALTLAGGSGNAGCGQIENLTLIGAGSANPTTGIQMGTATVGCSGATLKNVNIGEVTHGFGTGLTFAPLTAYLAQLINVHIQGNTTGLILAGEGNNFTGGLIGSNVTGVSCSQPNEAAFTQTSFDDNTTVAISVGSSSCRISFVSAHFENAGGGTDLYLSQSAGHTYFTGGDGFQSDTTSGTGAQFATVSGGSIDYNATICAPSGRTITQLFNLSGSANAVLRPRLLSIGTACSTTGTSTIFNSSYTGGLVVVDAIAQANNSNTGFTSIKASLPQLPDLIGTEASGRTYRIRENGGLWQLLDLTSGHIPMSIDVNDNLTNAGLQISSGTGPSITGTGACATITTQLGGAFGGTFKCTGATGAATVTFTPPSGPTPNGYTCIVFDETTRANLLQQTSHSTTTCVLTATSITQNDVLVFSIVGW